MTVNPPLRIGRVSLRMDHGNSGCGFNVTNHAIIASTDTLTMIPKNNAVISIIFKL